MGYAPTTTSQHERGVTMTGTIGHPTAAFAPTLANSEIG